MDARAGPDLERNATRAAAEVAHQDDVPSRVDVDIELCRHSFGIAWFAHSRDKPTLGSLLERPLVDAEGRGR